MPLVAILMGSKSDAQYMQETEKALQSLGISFETRVMSAHRTPDQLFEYVESAERRGLEVIIAAAGGAAHLAGVTAAKTVLPVLGVPMESKALKGLEAKGWIEKTKHGGLYRFTNKYSLTWKYDDAHLKFKK